MAGRRQPAFRWTSDNLTTSLKNAPARVNIAVASACEYQARRSENFMRANARWTDQTANARNGLHAVAASTKGSHVITLAHGMPYGIWLEVRWSGKYGIIPEAVRTGGMELMAMLGSLFKTAGL